MYVLWKQYFEKGRHTEKLQYSRSLNALRILVVLWFTCSKLFCCRYDSVIAWMFCGNNILKSLGDTQKNCGALLPFFKCVAYPSRFASMVTCSMVPCFSRNPNWCIEMVLLVWRCCLIRFKSSSLNIFDRNGIRLIVILFVTASPLFCRCTWIVVNRF